MSMLEINLVGAPEFRLNGAPLNLGRRKSEALLADLAHYRGVSAGDFQSAIEAG